MSSNLSFSTFEPLRETPGVCTVCGSKVPIFEYEFHGCGPDGEVRTRQGFCCGVCSVVLLTKLEHTEARQWREEEASLRADGVDVSDFHRHRLAAFSAGKR